MYIAFLIDFVVFFFITIQSNVNMTEIQHKTNIFFFLIISWHFTPRLEITS